MPVDPNRGSEKAGQKSSGCAKRTGNGPNLEGGSTKPFTPAGAQVTDCKITVVYQPNFVYKTAFFCFLK